MSSDQRPGRVRVFSSSTAAAPVPARRRGDAAAVAPSPVPPVPAVQPAARGGFPVLAGLFLIGCAVGGALMAWSGLLGPQP